MSAVRLNMWTSGSRRGTSSGGNDLVAVVPQSDLSGNLSAAGLAVVIEAISRAATIDFTQLEHHLPLAEDREYFQRWPGEHYKFLTGLASVLSPQLVLDIGTYHGASALALSLHSERVVTYDISDLHSIGNAYEDLCDDRPNVSQQIGDLSEADFFESQIGLIQEADLIFIDGPKDGKFEYEVVPKLVQSMKSQSLLVLDDIRFANMRDLWIGIPKPRIDVGSFAHSSGTGVVFI